ncbi:metallophosphoesterase [Leucobacter sp. cx-169]|uniref:metallophosphoesterase family protein n=1 Tax=Leucobacter sp. cx-169 TaxID=2770549 RepID=UPI00165DD450|nr:metallophosphoesterase [Leucobacter sp. cx-169]MBC9927346.1 metallophosphoesterase [Leucobacter sp. cx-169]
MSHLREQLSQVADVYVAGDWHADTKWARRALESISGEDCQVLLHVGDFGYFPNHTHGAQYLREVSALAVRSGIQILVTPGNHSDYASLNAGLALSGGEPFEAAPNVHLLPRGWRWTMSGRSFVSLGGAVSVDQRQRLEGVSWWPEEVITREEAEAVAAAGAADVLITHDTPLRDSTPEVALARLDPRWDLPTWLQDASTHSAELVQVARDGVKPKLHFHGHWHIPTSLQSDDDSAIISLGMNGQRFNLVSLDLDALAWTEHHVHSWDAS